MRKAGLTWAEDGTLVAPNGVIVGHVAYEGISYAWYIGSMRRGGYISVRQVEAAATREWRKQQEGKV